MKSLKCDLCEFVVESETFDDWVKTMRIHYATKHADWMKEMAKNPNAKEEGANFGWLKQKLNLMRLKIFKKVLRNN